MSLITMALRGLVASGALTLVAAAVAAAPATAAPGGAPLANAHSGKCVDVSQGSKADGAAVVQWTCTGRPNQRWNIGGLKGSGSDVKLRNGESGKCLDISEKSNASGAVVHQWGCEEGRDGKDSSAGSQLWRMAPKSSARGWKYYVITNAKSNKCLDVAGGSNTDGINLIQRDCNGGQTQLWRIQE